MKRVIHRDKGKAHILQMMCRDFFSQNDVEEAVMEIKPNKMTRSQKQNSLYWKWISQLAFGLWYNLSHLQVD